MINVIIDEFLKNKLYIYIKKYFYKHSYELTDPSGRDELILITLLYNIFLYFNIKLPRYQMLVKISSLLNCKSMKMLNDCLGDGEKRNATPLFSFLYIYVYIFSMGKGHFCTPFNVQK